MQPRMDFECTNKLLPCQSAILSNIAAEAEAGHGSEGYQLNKRPFCNAFTGQKI